VHVVDADADLRSLVADRAAAGELVNTTTVAPPRHEPGLREPVAWRSSWTRSSICGPRPPTCPPSSSSTWRPTPEWQSSKHFRVRGSSATTCGAPRSARGRRLDDRGGAPLPEVTVLAHRASTWGCWSCPAPGASRRRVGRLPAGAVRARPRRSEPLPHNRTTVRSQHNTSRPVPAAWGEKGRYPPKWAGWSVEGHPPPRGRRSCVGRPVRGREVRRLVVFGGLSSIIRRARAVRQAPCRPPGPSGKQMRCPNRSATGTVAAGDVAVAFRGTPAGRRRHEAGSAGSLPFSKRSRQPNGRQHRNRAAHGTPRARRVGS
jgi:hypothetical protein